MGRTLAPAHAVYIAAEVADALHYAWNSQDEEGRPLHVVHRAVSPMSIRLESSGRVNLTDFCGLGPVGCGGAGLNTTRPYVALAPGSGWHLPWASPGAPE